LREITALSNTAEIINFLGFKRRPPEEAFTVRTTSRDYKLAAASMEEKKVWLEALKLLPSLF
jgi:hypothetical protein